MSYARKGRLRQRYAKVGGHRIAVGGWFDDIVSSVTDQQDSADISGCMAQADAATADIDAKRLDLAQNWRPTGFYSAADMTKMIGLVSPMLAQAQSMAAQSMAEADNSSATGQLKNALDEISRHAAQLANYQAAAAQAGSAPINAPGFKEFITNAIGAASAAMSASVALSCLKPWLASAVDALGRAATAVWAAAKTIAGAVASLAGGAIKVVEETGALLQYLPYAAAAVGVYIVITELGRYKKRRS